MSDDLDVEYEADQLEMETYAAAIAQIDAQGPGPTVASGDESEFRDFFDRFGFSNFSYKEFLFLGGSHYAGSKCKGLNALPPKDLWDNIVPTVRVLVRLREKLDCKIRLLSIYRNETYNRCLSGTAKESQHKAMRAVDFIADVGKPSDWHAKLVEIRDVEKLFLGGLGLYKTFVHVDTRGHNADWRG